MGGSRVATPVARAIGVAAACWSLGACYVLQPRPTSDVPPIGSRIAVDVTDAGRVALGGLMGPEIAQIEGRLVGRDNANGAGEYELAVTTVRLLRGGEQVWKGERVTIRRDYVARMYDREFSKGRTAIAASVGAAVVTYFATQALTGFGHGDDAPTMSDSANSRRRPVRP